MKDVVGYEGLYAVTSCGKVWSYKSKRFLKAYKNKYGYYQVKFCKDGTRKDFFVHKLVAEAYIPNPDGLETVDHIDGNKDHNYVKNLQWLSGADNTRKAHNKKVRCVETDEVFDSITIAAKEKGLCKTGISNVCKGKSNHVGGYHFEFI